MYRGYERLCRDVLGSGFRVFQGFQRFRCYLRLRSFGSAKPPTRRPARNELY